MPHPFHVLGLILARAGSKGLPGKNVRPLLGRPLIAYTIEHARTSRLLSAVRVSTDCPAAAEIALQQGITVIQRPASLATDDATVAAAARHAVACHEAEQRRVTHVVILYANIPLRSPTIIDRVVQHLLETGADSVRTVAPVGKLHPDWLHRLDGDRMVQYRRNNIDRRQNLEPLYYHDGAVVAVSRASLMDGDPADPHALFGVDRRAVVQAAEDSVDVDTELDLLLAEAVLRRTARDADPSR